MSAAKEFADTNILKYPFSVSCGCDRCYQIAESVSTIILGRSNPPERKTDGLYACLERRFIERLIL